MTVYDFDNLPEDVLLQINQLCNAYEAACRSNLDETPLIENWLTEVPDDYRTVAFWELLPVEVAYRRRTGQPCDLAVYCHRFPDHDSQRLEACIQSETFDGETRDQSPPSVANPTQIGSEQTRLLKKTIGDYEIIDVLGKGGMGAVYRAVHRHMDRTVALKILRPEISRDVRLKQRFQREVKAAARLSHPNIVAAFDAREEDGVYCLITELIDADDLLTQVRRDGPLSAGDAIDVILQTARGLEYAHRQGIIHRDIKPANLLRDKTGSVKILDMGLARVEQSAIEGDQTELTATGMMMGTAEYMSPEQARNTKNADARSDIYSLGCTLYFLLTGRPIYRGETAIDTILAHDDRPIPTLPRGSSGDDPQALERIFQRMVAKKPADRFQSMTELIAALEPLQEGQSQVEKPAFRKPKRNRPANKSFSFSQLSPSGKRLTALAAAGLGAVVLVVLIFLFAPDPAPNEPTTPHAIRFNGETSYVAAPTLTLDPSQSVTLEVICRIDRLKLANLISCLGPDWMALFLSHDGNWGVAKQVGSESQLIATLDRTQTGPRYHVAGIWDGRELQLFVNGQPVETAPMGYEMPDTTGGLYIGGVRPDLLPQGENNRFFAGRIEAVRISRGLRYTAAFPPPTRLESEAETLALYQFDEGKGQITHDDSGNGHDATLFDAEWVPESMP